MAQDVRLDLLLKEIKDLYVQENFRKLKRYLDCLEQKIESGSPTVEGDTTIVVGGGTDITFHKDDLIVDAFFLTTRDAALDANPETDSESVYLNGLLLSDTCYSISGTVLTIDPGLDLEEGDEIYIRYASLT